VIDACPKLHRRLHEIAAQRTMTALGSIVATVAAVVDWWAVGARNRSVEYAAKPTVIVGLMLAATSIDATSGAVQAWFVGALVLSLAGDVFLMLRHEQFVAGLASFLFAHLAYVGGMIVAGIAPAAFSIGVAVAAVAVATVGRRIAARVHIDHPRLLIPVRAYIGAISLMLATAVGTTNAVAIAGAALFYASDAMLGWNRFVASTTHGRLAVIVPYHLGQALLVLALWTL
jgi:uncharacterized membrane protein YhhN